MIASAIVTWRQDAGFSRERVAAICDRSLATVSRWEKMQSEPRLKDVHLMEQKHSGLVTLLFGECKE